MLKGGARAGDEMYIPCFELRSLVFPAIFFCSHSLVGFFNALDRDFPIARPGATVLVFGLRRTGIDGDS